MTLNPEASRRGGSVTAAQSPAKARAIAAAHRARRGSHDNDPGISPRELAALLRRLAKIVGNGLSWPATSRRKLAAHLRVHERSVRRWLSGRCWPRQVHVRKMQAWLAERETGRKPR